MQCRHVGPDALPLLGALRALLPQAFGRSSSAFVAYVDSSEFGKGTFGKFLVEWLGGQQPQPVVDLLTVGRSGTRRVAAVESNEAFIREERIQLRALLLRAGREGKLLFQNGAMLHDFVESADAAATSAELDELDDTE